MSTNYGENDLVHHGENDLVHHDEIITRALTTFFTFFFSNDHDNLLLQTTSKILSNGQDVFFSNDLNEQVQWTHLQLLPQSVF